MNERLPYGRQSLGPEETELVSEVLASDWLTQGPRVADFESALAAACDAPFAVAVSHGTAALYLACLAADLGPGDRFLTTPITFAATANAAVMCGATPVFVDIDPGSCNLDPKQVAAALAADPDIRVVLPVHLGGRVCDMERLAEVTERYRAVIIEDACHAIGGSWQCGSGDWHAVGSCSHAAMTCFSFHPVKSMTTGEGGAITTRDPAVAERLQRLRAHGVTRDPARLREQHGGWYYEMQDLGTNARLTDLQAVIGLVQLGRLPGWQRRRLELIQRYDRNLADIPQVIAQQRPAGEDRSCWHLMIVRAERRRELYDFLQAQGYGVQVHYIPVHLQPWYRDRFGTGPGDCSLAEDYYSRALSLPLFPAMTDEDCDRVCAAVREFYHG